jgi:hypothetical protein
MKLACYVYLLFGFVLLNLSCKEEIPIELAEDIGKIVIESEINDAGSTQYTKISKTTSFGNTISFEPYDVTSVVVSDDGGLVDTLIRIRPGVYQTNRIQGTVGRKYLLEVNDQGTIYQSSSRMMPCPSIDSSYIFNFLNAENRYAAIKFRDAAGETNYYRYFIRLNRQPPKTMYVFEDKLINGAEWRFTSRRQEEKMKVGDTAEFILLSTDKANFEYFNVLIQNQLVTSNGNEQVAPTNPPSNISNGALGYFSAHSRRTSIVVAER